jgi:type II secretory pathway component PulJ
MTLIELMIVSAILATVILITTSILLSTNRVQEKTVQRATVQGDSRQALTLMTNELRQAGADPRTPPAGIVGIVSATETSIHTRADLNGNGVIETAEPSEDVTFSFDSTGHAITRDPGSGPAVLLDDVTGMSISYFDSANQPVTPLPLSTANAARVHSIGLRVTCLDRDSRPFTLATRVTLKNL